MPPTPTPAAWVYVLRCADDTLYTGWTTDVPRRLERHLQGKASRYTASRLPVELALCMPMPDRSAARREEARIKGLDRAAKLALIAGAGAGAGAAKASPSPPVGAAANLHTPPAAGALA